MLGILKKKVGFHNFLYRRFIMAGKKNKENVNKIKKQNALKEGKKK